MGSVPTPRTFVAGEIESAAYMNSLGAVLSFLQNPPRCRVYATAAQSIPNAAYAALTFGGEAWDTDNIHSTTSNTDRLTIATPGLYLVQGQAAFGGSNTTGQRYGLLQKNGTFVPNDTLDSQSPSASVATTVGFAEEVSLVAGDYLQFFVYQASGAALNTAYTTGYTAWFSCRWVAAS